MRSMFSIVFVALFSLAGAGIAAEASPAAPGAPMLLAQAGKGSPACLEKCEKAKKDCMAQYTKSDSTSGRYVTPEGLKVCMGAYHDCKKNCPR